jgi:hypothetical protein
LTPIKPVHPWERPTTLVQSQKQRSYRQYCRYKYELTEKFTMLTEMEETAERPRGCGTRERWDLGASLDSSRAVLRVCVERMLRRGGMDSER